MAKAKSKAKAKTKSKVKTKAKKTSAKVMAAEPMMNEYMDFDAMDCCDEPHASDDVFGMLDIFTQSVDHQSSVAVELTRIVVENMPAEERNEENIMAAFSRISNKVYSTHPLKDLWEKFGE